MCYPKDHLPLFLDSYPSLLSLLKTLTGQLFVPLSLQPSPMLPDSDMLVMLRNIERLDKLRLDSESIMDEKRLARQFVHRPFKVAGRGAIGTEEMRVSLQKELE